MTINIIRPNHGPASAVRSIHYSFVRDVNPLAVNPYAIVTVLGFPIGIVDALRITPIAAWPFAAMQARIPTIQLGVFMIVGASVIEFRHRQNDSQANEHCKPPRATVHLTPNWITYQKVGKQVLSSMQ
jgi:hypothetical protein